MIGPWRWTLIHDDRDELDATARHVGLTLAVHADGDGTGARPTVETLATACRRKRPTIRRALRVLEQLGYIAREQPSRRRATRYRLIVPSGVPMVPTERGPDGTPSRAETGPNGTHSDGPDREPLEAETGPEGPDSVGPLGSPSGVPSGPRPATTSNDVDGGDTDIVAKAVTTATGLIVDTGIRRLIADGLADGWTADQLAEHLATKATGARSPGLLVTVLRDLPPPEPMRPRIDLDACPDCEGQGTIWPEDGSDPWQCTHPRLERGAA